MTKSIDKAKENFINKSGVEFTDVTCKSRIIYNFPTGQSVDIKNPVYMATLPTGVNLVYDADGMCYKIRPAIGWWKTWETRSGCAHFIREDVVAQTDLLNTNSSKVTQINS